MSVIVINLILLFFLYFFWLFLSFLDFGLRVRYPLNNGLFEH